MPEEGGSHPVAPGRQSRPPRQAPRFHAGRVSFRSSAVLDATLLNLSAVGAAIETNDAPRIGAEVLCELETEHTSAMIPGQIRWCRLGRTANNGGDVVPVYRAGIEFSNGTPQNLLRILRAAGLRRSGGEA